MLSSLPRVYPLLGLCGGYAIVMLFNPVRLALRDGFRCITRFKRIWLTFILLGFAYSVFQFATFTPLQQPSDLDFSQVLAPAELGVAKLCGNLARSSAARAGRGRGDF